MRDPRDVRDEVMSLETALFSVLQVMSTNPYEAIKQDGIAAVKEIAEMMVKDVDELAKEADAEEELEDEDEEEAEEGAEEIRRGDYVTLDEAEKQEVFESADDLIADLHRAREEENDARHDS